MHVCIKLSEQTKISSNESSLIDVYRGSHNPQDRLSSWRMMHNEPNKA